MLVFRPNFFTFWFRSPNIIYALIYISFGFFASLYDFRNVYAVAALPIIAFIYFQLFAKTVSISENDEIVIRYSLGLTIFSCKVNDIQEVKVVDQLQNMIENKKAYLKLVFVVKTNQSNETHDFSFDFWTKGELFEVFSEILFRIKSKTVN